MEEDHVRAWTTDRYGGPEVIRLTDVGSPEPAEGEVLVDVRAASVNPLDWHELRGEPWLVRLTGGLRRPKRAGCGTDLAGVVAAVGPGVTDLAVGDEVFGTGAGTFAEVAVARAIRLAPAPQHVDARGAASLPVAGLTALQALRAGGVADGTRVLVVGASGGVGSLAVQIATAWGAEVTGVCSGANVDLVRSLGAAHVVDYTTGGLDALTGPFDATLDSIGSLPFRRCRQLLRPGGTYVVVGGPDGGRLLGPLSHMIRARLAFAFGRRRARTMLASITRADLEELGRLVDDGSVRPVIDRIVPFADVPDAVRHVETRRARGKVVVEIATPSPGQTGCSTLSA
jgi:NADPH:quinone reductase-like Zn-dependent oxidoreductase